ncbi:MAG: hypothetical protein Q9191_008007 [Dirinaria sp. TL-2023a]
MLGTTNRQSNAILLTITILTAYTAALAIQASPQLLPNAFNQSTTTNQTSINSAPLVRPAPSEWPDPYSYHLDGYFTTTEFYDYHGSIAADTCLRCIEKPWLLARRNAYRSNTPLGTQLRSWTCRDRVAGYKLVLVPREQMTWRMLKELWVGNYVMCVEVEREFDFEVTVEEGGVVGEGHLMRD